MTRTGDPRRFAGQGVCCDSALDASKTDRRHFLAGAAALGSLAVAGGGIVSIAHAEATARRIDVHHHISPPAWLDALRKAKLDTPPAASWTPERSIADMDAAGVATSIASLTTPQVSFLAKEEAVRIARESNEYAKTLVSAHPSRFGMFAMLPLPHIDDSLHEIEYALDVLKADGIGLLTSYADRWLGDPGFAPVFEELNRRKATVFTHPTSAKCCVNLVPGIPDSTIELAADTTRTIANLIFSGTSQRYRNITFIFCHGGGVLTAVAERLQIQMPSTPLYKGKFAREDVDGELKRFYYDTAQVSNAVTIEALARLVPMSQIVFGSDFPYRTAAEHVKGLTGIFHGDDLAAIGRENALRFLPRLKTG